MRRLLSTLPVLALLAAGCGGSSGSSGSDAGTSDTGPKPAAGSKVTVTMKNIAFNPKSVPVKVGQTVTWTNQDSVDHNVRADAGASFSSQTFGNGGTYSFTPKKAGTIKYECTIHPGMTAELKVTG